MSRTIFLTAIPKIAVHSAGVHYQFLLRVIDKDSLSEIAQYDPGFVFECFHLFQSN